MAPLDEIDRENLTAYLDGEVDEETARSIEARINTEPELRLAADAMKQAWDMLDYLPKTEASSNFTNKTLERLEIHKPVSTMSMPRAMAWQKPLVYVLWALGLLIAFVVGFSVARVQGPTLPNSSQYSPNQVEETLQNRQHLLENKQLYDPIDNLDFLKGLEHPELFGEDSL